MKYLVIVIQTFDSDQTRLEIRRAMVLDRLLLYIFSLTVTTVSADIIPRAPALYDKSAVDQRAVVGDTDAARRR